MKPYPWREHAEAIAEEIAVKVGAGELRLGSRLPTYIDLAAERGIAVGTVQKSMQLLADLGYVRIEPNVGMFLLEAPQIPLPAPRVPVRRPSLAEQVLDLTRRVNELEAAYAEHAMVCDCHPRE
jgi:DNA-binding GntR family transcriptional regulator